MVLGELVLRPIPVVVAHRVAEYAEALGIKDHFVRVARRYAQGAYGLAWMDLARSGFVEHVREADGEEARAGVERSRRPTPTLRSESAVAGVRRASARLARLRGLGHVRQPGFALPGAPGGPPAYLAQHDFVHVLADYGTNLRGEVEVFALIGRADPDPQGFAWLATLVGLFETGYITTSGFFDRDLRDPVIQAPGHACPRCRRHPAGKLVCAAHDKDLFDFPYHDHAARPVDEVREMLGVPPKSAVALEAGSAPLSSPEGTPAPRSSRLRPARRRSRAATPSAVGLAARSPPERPGWSAPGSGARPAPPPAAAAPLPIPPSPAVHSSSTSALVGLLSPRAARTFRRARCSRDRTVPTLIRRVSATSS